MAARKTNRRTFVTFGVCEQRYALPSENVERITAMAEVDSPPNSPQLLAGFLNLADTVVPVIHLNTLFRLPADPLHLWTPLLIMRTSTQRFALLVDKVHQVLVLEDAAVAPLPPGHALNDCVEGIVRSENDSALLLSPDRLLLEEEQQVVEDLRQLAEQRVRDLHSTSMSSGVEA